jgi:hypothetical protein
VALTLTFLQRTRGNTERNVRVATLGADFKGDAISRGGAFLGLLRLIDAQPSPTGSRQIAWPSVVTVISAAILIGAEVFGAAFAGGWALAILFGLDDTGAHILQAVLFALGVLIMIAFIRAAQRVEPFTRRA